MVAVLASFATFARQTTSSVRFPKGHSDVTRACVSMEVAETEAGFASEVERIMHWLIEEVNSRTSNGLESTWTPHASCDPDVATTDTTTTIVTFLLDSNLILEASNYTGNCIAAARGSFVVQVQPATTIGTELRNKTRIILEAATPEGLQSATGRLLRELYLPPRPNANRNRQTLNGLNHNCSDQAVTIPNTFMLQHDAALERWTVRGHQIPVSRHPLEFRTRDKLQQFAKDLATFGTTRLEIAHVNDHVNVSQFSEFSDICAKAGLSASIWADCGSWADNYTATFEVPAYLESARLHCLLSMQTNACTLAATHTEACSFYCRCFSQ